MEPPDRWPFHAREGEVEQVVQLLDPGTPQVPADGRPEGTGGAVLAGPTGVGKTRLLREVLAVLEGRGRRVHLSVATRSAVEIPYGSLAGLVPDRAPTDHQDSDSWHAAVAARLTEGRDGAAPVVLAVDDAHLLDPGGAALLLHLCVSGAATVLVTVRHGEPAPDAITALWRDGLAHRIDLQPFSPAQTESFIDALLEGPVARRTRQRLAAVSGGNVLFAGELVRGAVESGTMRQVDGVWTWDGALVLAPRLVDAVDQRLGALGSAEREALALVAMGEPLPLGLAERALDPAAVHTLEAAGLVAVAGAAEGAPGLRVSHPLYGELALAGVGTLQERRLRRLLVEDLQAAGGHRSGLDTVRLARWQLALGDPVPVDLLREAAALANRFFDHPLAERLARAALRVEPRSASAGIELAAALNGQNSYAAAEEVLAALEPDVLADGSAQLHQHYLDTRHTSLLLGLGRIEQARDMLRRADAARPAAPGTGIRPTESLVAVYSGAIALSQGHLAETLRLIGPVLGADPDRVPALARLMALEQAGEALIYRAEFDRARRAHAQLRDLADHEPALAARGLANAMLQEVLARASEGAAGAALELSLHLQEQLGSVPDPAVTSLATMVLGACQLRCGLVASAVPTLVEAVHAYGRNDHGGQLSWALALLAQAQALSGDGSAARLSLARAEATQLPQVPARHEVDLVTARALVHWVHGRTTEAIAVARAGMPDFPEMLVHRARLVHLAALLGAPPRSVLPDLEALEALAPGGGGGDGPIHLTVSHVRALAEGDGPALEEVADHFTGLGAHLLAAEAAGHAAVAYRRARLPAAAERAAARSRVLAARCEGARSPALEVAPALAHLTAREAEVTRLAARGLSNAAIAAELTLSVRTVESHLYQVFGKLGVTHRSQLAGLVGTSELESPLP
ncbi:LuxR family transcriptional regulator [Ornithinicoccus hortensis]